MERRRCMTGCAGFRDWADSTAGINADTELPSEIWEYLNLREALHPTSADYEEEERLVMEFLRRMCGAICTASDKNGIQESTFAGKPGNDNADGPLSGRIREYLNSSALYWMKIDAGECQETSEEGNC